MIQTTKVLNREVEKIGDIGEIADLLEVLKLRGVAQTDFVLRQAQHE